MHHAMYPLHRPGCAVLRCKLLPANQPCVELPELGMHRNIPHIAAAAGAEAALPLGNYLHPCLTLKALSARCTQLQPCAVLLLR